MSKRSKTLNKNGVQSGTPRRKPLPSKKNTAALFEVCKRASGCSPALVAKYSVETKVVWKDHTLLRVENQRHSTPTSNQTQIIPIVKYGGGRASWFGLLCCLRAWTDCCYLWEKFIPNQYILQGNLRQFVCQMKLDWVYFYLCSFLFHILWTISAETQVISKGFTIFVFATIHFILQQHTRVYTPAYAHTDLSTHWSQLPQIRSLAELDGGHHGRSIIRPQNVSSA